MEQITHFINNLTDAEFNGYPVQHLIDNLGVHIPVRLVGTIQDDNGVAYSVYLEQDRTPIFLPLPPAAAMPARFIDDQPADEMADGAVAEFDEERLSDRSRARRNARVSRRANRRAARQAFEQQQRQRQPAMFANPHNIFQQHQQPQPPMQRPQSPVHQQPSNPASRRQRRKASRLSRERREARIRAGYVVGGKTRRRHTVIKT